MSCPETVHPPSPARRRPGSRIAEGLRRGPGVPGNAEVSTFGKYSGYSEAVYDGWVRSSRYVTARDGTRLAVDVFLRPTRHGKVATEKLPVVWTHHRYQRAQREKGKVYTIVGLLPMA